MIVGVVTDLQGRVEVVFRLSGQADRTVACVVDTGFQGELALPPATVAALGLSADGHVRANLADNSDVPVPVFSAVIVWDERDVDVNVMAIGGRPLVGTELVQGFNLSADFEEDRQLAPTPM